jgi:cation:H+ antiporter
MMNMMTLALLDFFQWFSGKPSIFIRPAKRNALAAGFAMLLLLISALSIFLTGFGLDFLIFGFSIYTLIIILIYFLAQKYIFEEEKVSDVIPGQVNSGVTLPKAVFGFVLLGLIVVGAGSWLPFIGNEIISVMGWGTAFVGVLFLGLATTLPEMVVSFSALRMGHISMGKGNLFGSNIFNLGLLFIVDIFYRQGSLFANVSPNMLYAALFGALLMGIAYLAIKTRARRRLLSLLMLVIYLASLFVLFRLGIV